MERAGRSAAVINSTVLRGRRAAERSERQREFKIKCVCLKDGDLIAWALFVQQLQCLFNVETIDVF